MIKQRLTSESLNQLIAIESLTVERNREERRTSDLIYHLEVMAALEELREYKDAASVSQPQLLPCPFCGSEAHFDSASAQVMSDERVYAPACTECSCELMNGPVKNYAGSGWYKTKEAAATDWNCRRAAQGGAA
ncbi:Lar family restriction alleviation protein [Salmonella enterica]|nr:Lar family restriction alleviation protein [Salmonella enterica]EHL6597275.1 Lar family restriction alleviation protein [Salmonella enterica]EHL6623785.1 Lar family restriction alleviation protein [Salmonella enterica]EHL6709411.1 Lar family restriction alleviation protein [Salmonella enterica]EHL6760335.1 Lar family restriction alleviation protein [Salmonella enterica]